MFNFGGILPEQVKSPDYRNVQYVFWLGNLTLNIVKMDSLNIQFHLFSIYYDCLKGSLPSLPDTRDRRPFGRESDRIWCHCHTTSMIKLFGSQPMAPWASGAAYGQGEKFSA